VEQHLTQSEHQLVKVVESMTRSRSGAGAGAQSSSPTERGFSHG
jgi:hypothetical protein